MKFTTLCYIEKEDNYLMLHRVKKENDANKDKWIGLGGKFEQGESPEDCLLREIKEETGLTLTNYRFRGIVTFISDQWEDEYMCLYTADEYEGSIGSCKEGELEWVRKEKINELNLWEGDRLFLDLLAEDAPFFSLKLVYQGESLVEAVLNGKALEFFELLNEDGTKTGKIKSRTLVHQDGDLHGTSHIWVMRRNPNGQPEILLQKRSKTKDAFPGCYDISSAGHMDLNETFLETAVRELREELGIVAKKEELKFIHDHYGFVETEFYGKPFKNRELSKIFLYEVKDMDQEFVLQKEEVEEVCWMPYEELVRAVEAKEINHCIFQDELKYLKQYL